MKKFLLFFSLLFFSLLFFDKTIACFFDEIYKTTYKGQSGGKINYLLNNYDSVSVLSIGDSRCAHHVNPEKLGQNCYNLSHNGMSLIFQTGLIDQLANNEKLKIDTILLNLDINELLYLSKQQISDIKFLKFYYDKNEWITNQINNLSFFERYKYIFSIYRFNGKIASLMINKITQNYEVIPHDGYVPKLSTNNDSLNVMWQYKKVMKNSIENSSQINSLSKSLLLKIKSDCFKSNIKLICFISPTFKQKINSRKECLSFFKENKIMLLNYTNEFYENKDLQDIFNWEDVYHLNQKGADILTKKIRLDLNNLSHSI